MDPAFRASPRRSYELPKPDAGLAEWTSKIKAIQRQVDADEDNEQKRLEEEIAAARQARLRRSRGGTPSRADSADLSSPELIKLVGNTSDISYKDTTKSPSEMNHDREAALRKLMDRNHVYNPDKLGATEGSSKQDSVSLASFIGGRATGPRLNRHAPQADALDGSQYLQPNLIAPHPIFGTGGVAVPGITTKREKSPAPLIGSEMSERHRPASISNLKPDLPHVKNDLRKPDEAGKQEKAIVNRRSFNTMAKSPSSTFAQRYTDVLEKSTSGGTTQPLLIKRKSIGYISKEPPLPSPTKVLDDTSKVSMSPSTDSFSPPWKTSQSTPNPAPSYLRAKSSSSFPAASPVKSGLKSYEGFLTSASTNNIQKTTSRDRDLTASSLPRNEAPSSNRGSTPLRQLMEKNNVYNPDKVATDYFGKSVAERAQTTSLAAFMGGSGRGVRLNKHAPQVDAHDPTQFIQPDLNNPHPIFGKGGVAMPGMIAQTSSPNLVSGIDNTGLSKPSLTKKAVWPPVCTPSKTEERPVSALRTGGRARTISAPRPESSSSYVDSREIEATPDRSRSPVKGTVPLRERTFSTPSSRQSIVTPSLARPIQPEVKKTASLSPQVPATTPSPAFNKRTTQKDLTPSLSKLQGRGFVQNMVKASSHVSNMPSSSSSSPPRPVSTTGKKVLDRWQPSVQPESPTKPSPPLSKNSTAGASTSSGASTYRIKSSSSISSLRKPAPVSSSPPKQVEDPYPRSRTPGLGSATTTVTVVKPSKSFTDLTELGMKTPTNSKSSSSRKTPIYISRDKTRNSQKATDNFPTARTNQQVLTEIPQIQNEHFEEDIYVPQSAPAWMGTFDFHSGSQKFQVAASTRAALEMDSMKDPTPHDAANTGSFKRPWETSMPDVTDFQSPREQVALPFKLSRNSYNRPSAMEVAQAFNDIPSEEEEDTAGTTRALIPEQTSPVGSPTKFRGPLSQSQAEKRRSTYEKYSTCILPPLPEEDITMSSPAATLKAPPESPSARKATQEEKPRVHQHIGSSNASDDHDRLPTQIGIDEGRIDPSSDQMESYTKLSDTQITDLLKPRPLPPQQYDDVLTISVELLSIVGNAATVISEPSNIFYDSEILAIVHRVKSKASGLASTSVWCWLGKQARLGDRDDKKLQELSRRYGTRAKMVHQLTEPTELIQILGGRLAIRQGSRRHWTSENTTMHLVRFCRGITFIDEHDFSIKNMCSAFSYCFSLLGSVYVWHGCGSSVKEREASIEYAHTLSPDPVTPIELFEGENDEDGMLWMMLGDADYAKADYWRWRRTWSDYDPRIWKVDPSNSSNVVIPVEFISMEQQIRTSIYVVDCIWELFVLVGRDARERRAHIRCALDLAKRISMEMASARPYRPTLHLLVFPSQLPMDLRLGIRDLDQTWLNDAEVPDYMNLMPCPPSPIGDPKQLEMPSGDIFCV